MSIERIKARLDELAALNDRHRRHLTGIQRNALPGLIVALRVAVTALEAICSGEIAEDAVDENECWEQLAERRLAEIERLLAGAKR